MKLKEVFDQLTSGELSQLCIGGAEPGVIRESNYKIVVNSINLGLSNIFARFPLKEGRLTLILQPNQTDYLLDTRFAASNVESEEPIRYIDDVGAPYTGDLLKIQGVFTESGGEVPLNVLYDKWSCLTPSTSLLRVPMGMANQTADLPESLKSDTLLVTYRAAHVKFDTSDYGFIEPEELEVDIPYPFLEPLLYFVASRAHHPVSLSSEVNPAASYAMKFEQACQQLSKVGVSPESESSQSRLRQKGFV